LGEKEEASVRVQEKGTAALTSTSSGRPRELEKKSKRRTERGKIYYSDIDWVQAASLLTASARKRL